MASNYQDHQQSGIPRRSSNSRSSSHSVHSPEDRSVEGEVSSLEKDFDARLQRSQYHNDAEQRPSTNNTPIVTEVHALKPSKHEMPDHCSYHGDISGHAAEQILKRNTRRNCYLTRYSRNHQKYMLSVIYIYNHQDKIRNFMLLINTDDSKYSLEGTEQVFDSLDMLLKYYETNRLDPEIKNAGVACQAGSSSRTSQRPQVQAESSHSTEQEVCEAVKKEIGKMLRHGQCNDQQPPEQLELIKEMFKQTQETNREVLNRLAEQQKELIEKMPTKKCAIL